MTAHSTGAPAHNPFVIAALRESSELDTSGFAEWDGHVEVGQCVVIDYEGTVERVDEDDDEQLWHGGPFWSVFLHQKTGGVQCVGDFRTEAEADAFAAGLIVLRSLR